MTHVLGWTVVKHTARSLTVFTAVDSGRSWRLGVGRISFISRCPAEPGETRRARQTLALLLLRHRSPSLFSQPTTLLTHSPRANVPRSMKKTKPGAPHLPKLLRLSVPVRQAHIEDMYGEYPVEKRDALCST